MEPGNIDMAYQNVLELKINDRVCIFCFYSSV